MTSKQDILALADRVDASHGSSNEIDVLVEVALFKPNSVYTSIRANTAGTKVIYTDRAGNQVTCWAEEWSTRPGTATSLRAIAEAGG